MSTPSSQALVKQNADTALMPPPPPTKRIKRPSQVVDEDEYTDALSHIIARDFFPGLLESEAQQDYLDALDTKDNDLIRDAGRRLRQAMTPGPRGRRGTTLAPSATPRAWQGETPTRTPSIAPSIASTTDTDGQRPKPPIDSSLSLGAFQAKYTSEDNESFNALLDRQNQKRAEKYAFFYNGNKLPSKQQLAQQKLLADKPAEQSTALVPRPSQNLDDRPASFDSFRNRQGPRNTLMFTPDGIEDTHETRADRAQAASLAPPKSVSYVSTRLPTAASSEGSPIPPSPSMSAIDAAIAGRPRPSSTDAGYSGAETPRVNGYAFVDEEPLPHELEAQRGVPVSDAEADAEERAVTMALLPTADAEAANNPFKLQAQSKREELHHRLVDKSNVQRRKPGAGRLNVLMGQEGRTPTPRFTSGPTLGRQTPGGNLTPAARLLASRIGGRTPGRADTLFGSQKPGDKSSRVWTPTPWVKKSTK